MSVLCLVVSLTVWLTQSCLAQSKGVLEDQVAVNLASALPAGPSLDELRAQVAFGMQWTTTVLQGSAVKVQFTIQKVSKPGKQMSGPIPTNFLNGIAKFSTSRSFRYTTGKFTGITRFGPTGCLQLFRRLCLIPKSPTLRVITGFSKARAIGTDCSAESIR